MQHVSAYIVYVFEYGIFNIKYSYRNLYYILYIYRNL